MWYKIWTFVAESIPVIVLSLLFTLIAWVFVFGTHTCEPPPLKCILCGDECPGHPFNFTIEVKRNVWKVK